MRTHLIPLTLATLALACGPTNDVVASEVATSVVSGALNNTSGSAVAMNAPSRPSRVRELMEALNPIGTAWAATWSCTGGSLSPAYTGPAGNPYAYTPLSCSVTWGNGKTASAVWSSTFALNYGSACDTTHAFFENQVAGCSVARTTAAGGNTRTLTGPNGNAYAVTHDTHGSGTGYDSTVAPAPNDNGLVVTCGANGCASSKTLAINGSHLTGTVNGSLWWDHTVSTPSPLAVTDAGGTRTVNGTVVVQHNRAKFTSTTTFSNVTYAGGSCCFPSGGSVSTTFSSGPNAGKTETLTFGAGCGEATLTPPNGAAQALTLQHCL